MSENEVTIDGVRYVAVEQEGCAGCAAYGSDPLCSKIQSISDCCAEYRDNGKEVIWRPTQVAPDELTAIRELNRELVEAGKLCVSAWNSVCDVHGWDRNHLVQFTTLSSLIAKARGEK